MNDLYYIFKITLNRFTNDLSRSLCAFLTGVGEGEASVYVDKEVEKAFRDSMRIEMSPSGWSLPARVHDKELHLLFEDEPTKEQVKIIKERLPLFEEAFYKNDEYAQYIGKLNLKVEHLELVRIEIKETPIKIFDDPKSAL